ncbi:MAG: hypothetical protein C4300_01455 [Thermus sp.]
MVRIVTDSGAHLPPERFREYGVVVVPLVVNMGGRTYYEGEDLDLETFYHYLRTSPELPKTSQPPVGRFYEVYRRLSEEGQAVVSLHLSSVLSGTYASAVAAREMLPGAEIHVVDTQLISVPQGILVLEAARMARAGATAWEIVERIEFMRERTVFYFVLDTLDGRTLELAQLRGQPVVLNFWASWCAPCRKEMPVLVRAWQRHGKHVHFVGVNVLDDPEEAQRFLEEFRVPYPSVHDPRGDTLRWFRVVGLPTTVFVSREGGLAGFHAGPFLDLEGEGALERAIREVLSR